MKNITALGRILVGIAYLFYGYLHFAHSAADAAVVPNSVGAPMFWVIFIGICWWATALSFFINILTRVSGILASLLLLLIFCFAILPRFDGVSSWLSMASIFAMIGGSLQVAAQGNLWPIRKNK